MGHSGIILTLHGPFMMRFSEAGGRSKTLSLTHLATVPL